MGKTKRPKSTVSVKPPEVRTSGDADAWKASTIIIHLSGFDSDGPWGFVAVKEYNNWKKILKTLESYQTMTWAELLSASGSVKSGTNHHEISSERLSKLAQDRMNEISINEDTVFSFHIEGRLRLYGIRDRAVCRIIWVDPWHNDVSRAVCPSVRK